MHFAPSLRESFAHIRPYLTLQPGVGSFWRDLALVFIIAALHSSIMPSLVKGVIYIDLVTPWIVAAAVHRPLRQSLSLAVLAALIIETHSAAPAGTYICAYWILTISTNFVREHLSWQQVFPWLVTFSAAGIWLIVVESFIIFVAHDAIELSLDFWLTQAGRLLVIPTIGVFLLTQKRPRDPQEAGLL